MMVSLLQVKISDCVARGEGRSKKMAEQHAAREALKLLGVIKEK